MLQEIEREDNNFELVSTLLLYRKEHRLVINSLNKLPRIKTLTSVSQTYTKRRAIALKHISSSR